MEAREAVVVAVDHVRQIFEGQLSVDPVIEEVWPSKQGDVWNVTLSLRFNPPSNAPAFPDVLRLGQPPKRKVVSVSAADGRAISVRDWPIIDAA
jgi:hypothetical protein